MYGATLIRLRTVSRTVSCEYWEQEHTGGAPRTFAWGQSADPSTEVEPNSSAKQIRQGSELRAAESESSQSRNTLLILWVSGWDQKGHDLGQRLANCSLPKSCPPWAKCGHAYLFVYLLSMAGFTLQGKVNLRGKFLEVGLHWAQGKCCVIVLVNLPDFPPSL